MRTARRFVLLLLMSLACTLAAHAQTAEKLWERNCMNCHGRDGSGANATSLLDEAWITDGSDRALFKAVKEGLPDHGMEAFGGALTDPEIWATLNHLRQLRNHHRYHHTDWRPTPRNGSKNEFTTQHVSYRVEEVVKGGLSVPWSIAWITNGTMLIAERNGNLRPYRNGRLGEPVRGTPEVWNNGQGGLLGIATLPDDTKNGWVYLSYSHPLRRGGQSQAMTRIVRGHIKNYQWVNEEVIFQAKPEHYSAGRNHFGCRIVFDDSGHLFFAIGDRGNRPTAQDLSLPSGKVYRLNIDGTVPRDNPFVHRRGAYAAIYSYGHRNPQGLAWDPVTKQLWETEHGPRGGDELNLIERGKNYGWPVVSFGIHYNGRPLTKPFPSDGEDFTMPVHHWTPSIATCGLAVVRSSRFRGWEGDLLAGGLAGNVIERVRVRDGRVVEIEPVVYGLGRVRDVAVGPDGLIYVALNGSDRIVRLVPVR